MNGSMVPLLFGNRLMAPCSLLVTYSLAVASVFPVLLCSKYFLKPVYRQEGSDVSKAKQACKQSLLVVADRLSLRAHHHFRLQSVAYSKTNTSGYVKAISN